MRSGKRQESPDPSMVRVLKKLEKLKASVQAKIERSFQIIKNLFGLKNVRYRRLAKNTAQPTRCLAW